MRLRPYLLHIHPHGLRIYAGLNLTTKLNPSNDYISGGQTGGSAGWAPQRTPEGCILVLSLRLGVFTRL